VHLAWDLLLRMLVLEMVFIIFFFFRVECIRAWLFAVYGVERMPAPTVMLSFAVRNRLRN